MGMGIIYTTIYTSRLTSPGYEKPINTLRQFLDNGIGVFPLVFLHIFNLIDFFKQDLHMCSTYISTDIVDMLVNSINEDYRQLSSRSLIYGENMLYRKQLFVERMCGILAARTTNNYISVDDPTEDMDQISSLRVMQDYLLRQYTGFALQKHSPYTKLFDWYIRRYT